MSHPGTIKNNFFIWHLPNVFFFFNEVHIQQVSGPPTKDKCNEHNIRFTIDKDGNIGVKRDKYDTSNQPKKAAFKYEREGRFCLGVAKIKNKEGATTGKYCPVFGYSGGNIVIIDAYLK